MEKKRQALGTALGLVFGGGIGIVAGSIVDEISWGIIIGGLVGLIIGSAYDAMSSRKK